MGVMGMEDPIAVAMTGDVRYFVGGGENEADASRSTNADGPKVNFDSISSFCWSRSSEVLDSLRAGRNGVGDVLERSDVYR